MSALSIPSRLVPIPSMNPIIPDYSNKSRHTFHPSQPIHHHHHHHPMHGSFDFSSQSQVDAQQFAYAQKGDEAFFDFSPEYAPPGYSAWSEWGGQQVAPENVPDQYFEPQVPFSGPSETSRPAVLSWPLECFVTNDPSLLTPESDVGSLFTSSDRFTPELLYTDSSSGDDCSNVFDMQFGDALSTINTDSPLYDGESPASSSSTSSPSSAPYDFPPSSRHTPYKRTPSPASSSSSTPGSRSIPASDHRRRFPCLLPGCDRRFTSQYTLKVHMEAHKPKPKVTFPCTHGCSERFSRQHDRLRHEVAKHGKVCEFSCDDCGRFFSTSKTLGNHKCPVAQGGTRWVNA